MTLFVSVPHSTSPDAIFSRRRATRWRTSIALLLAASLAGCKSTPPPAWLAGCPVQGIDVSRHQGDIDWNAVAESGVKFAWLKATEGGDHRDAKFRRNWLLARGAGIRRGAYHFVYWCRPAKDQAAWFVANVPDDPDALPPVLDIEWNPGSRTCPQKVSREKALPEIRTIVEAMEHATGRKPILYVPGDIYRDLLEGSFDDYPLWVRSIGERPEAEYDARPWVVWQYSDIGKVPGIKGDVDRNCASGMAAGPQGVVFSPSSAAARTSGQDRPG